MGDKIVCRIEVPYFFPQKDGRINRNYDMENPAEVSKFTRALVSLVRGDAGVRVICFKE